MQHRLTHGFSWGLVLFALILLSEVAGAQDRDSSLTVYGGVTVFNRPEFDSLVLVEFPFSLNRHEFEFFQPDTTSAGYFARIFAQITAYGIDGLPLDSASTYFSVRVPSMTDAGLEGYKVFNSLVLPLAPGIYSARLTIIDAVSKKEGEAFYNRVVVEPPRTGSLSLGGKCLAYDITYVGDSLWVPDNRMPKNGFDVIVNPLGVFSIDDSVMCLYAEAYNLDFNPESPGHFRLSYSALDRLGKTVREFGTKERTKHGSSAVIAERFDITDFPPGHYELQIVAADPADGQADTARMDFAVLAPYSAVASADDMEALYADPYDSLSLQDKQNLVYYMLSPVEKRTLEQLDDNGKEAFLRRYWQASDRDPTTTVIENRIEMIRRYQFANENFSTNEDRDDGWFTDRGRIYMTYGPWEDMDDIQHPQGGHPYQVWHYYSIREGAVFVFEDLRGFEDYTLTHSNVEGEVYSDYWNEILKFDYYKQD